MILASGEGRTGPGRRLQGPYSSPFKVQFHLKEPTCIQLRAGSNLQTLQLSLNNLGKDCMGYDEKNKEEKEREETRQEKLERLKRGPRGHGRCKQPPRVGPVCRN